MNAAIDAHLLEVRMSREVVILAMLQYEEAFGS